MTPRWLWLAYIAAPVSAMAWLAAFVWFGFGQVPWAVPIWVAGVPALATIFCIEHLRAPKQIAPLGLLALLGAFLLVIGIGSFLFTEPDYELVLMIPLYGVGLMALSAAPVAAVLLPLGGRPTLPFAAAILTAIVACVYVLLAVASPSWIWTPLALGVAAVATSSSLSWGWTAWSRRVVEMAGVSPTVGSPEELRLRQVSVHVHGWIVGGLGLTLLVLSLIAAFPLAYGCTEEVFHWCRPEPGYREMVESLLQQIGGLAAGISLSYALLSAAAFAKAEPRSVTIQGQHLPLLKNHAKRLVETIRRPPNSP